MESSSTQPLIAIVGQTATGKTSLSIELAQVFNGEVLGADSRQVYRLLDIGTAKVTEQEMKGVPHHLIDIADVEHRFSVAEFKEHAQHALDKITSRGNLPIVCGGSGMYVDAIARPSQLPSVPPNPELRAELNELPKTQLYHMIKEIDPRRAATIDPHNKVRLIRALEIIDALGSVPEQSNQINGNLNVLWIGLQYSDEELKERIKLRNKIRLENGMIDEVKNLHEQHNIPWARLEELGLEYRSISRFLQKKLSYKHMASELDTKIWQFARRQRTWFKRNPDIQWFHPEEQREGIFELVKNFLAK